MRTSSQSPVKGVMAYLLYNGSASYVSVARLTVRGAVGKPSLNRANQSLGVDPKPVDLSMARVKVG
jgi:hypothetical protein